MRDIWVSGSTLRKLKKGETVHAYLVQSTLPLQQKHKEDIAANRKKTRNAKGVSKIGC